MSVPIEKVLNDFMLADAAVAGLADTRMYPVKLPPSAVFPAITYFRVSTDRDETLDGPTGRAGARIQTSAWGNTYAEAKQLAEAIRLRLNGYRGPMTDGTDTVDVKRVSLITENDLHDDARDVFQVVQDWLIVQKED